MNVVGIVAEYNPFHNGHLHHLEQSKILTRSNYTVVVMSPCFVQRGGPAITNKWVRTKMALLAGADLVIELPTPYATASAEFFAKGSIALLHHTGIVDSLNFGSESNNIDLLQEVARVFVDEPDDFKALLKAYLDTGISFPSARAKAFIDYAQSEPKLFNSIEEIEEIIKTPNNILGIEYLKALSKLKSHVHPTTLERKGSLYHQEQLSGHLSSATAIRREIFKGRQTAIGCAMPASSYNLLQKNTKALDLSPFLCYRLLFSTPSDLANIVGITEGMENRILNTFKETRQIDQMIAMIKSKRFTQTTIQRILLNIVLQMTKTDFNQYEAEGGPQYIRVLGFRKSSQCLLTQLKAKATLPVIMNVGKDYRTLPGLAKQMLDFEIRTTNIYSALEGSTNKINLDYTHPLVIV